MKSRIRKTHIENNKYEILFITYSFKYSFFAEESTEDIKKSFLFGSL